ncbi:MAG: TonB-dependent receptor [Erythrobacter sp.]|uniref:TonB-dependent receptor domain-containing protein n=1 Tax=Erythrobacter sp. TaxID=1042 RepID=UPI0025D802C6|nr:TonB-dependent receptor [Erythrobacter sp.]MCL9999596.1 TonB-dependent receptor [Erythrobacter sp.]
MNKLAFLKAGAATAVIALTVSAPAYAQEADGAPEPAAQSEAASNEDVGQAIVVTGSRIASAEVDSPAPLQIVNEQLIEDSGVINIQELLLENPVFGTPTLSRTNAAFLTSGTGIATIDLRDLGSDRTLVLINGRRVVSSLAGSSTVDLNVIPTQFLQQVDILTGGASSLYGSDAVAGVVNFIYKTDFEGIDANAQYNITERGDDARYQANVTVGTNVADGRGNIMVHLGYSKEEGLLSRQRPNTRVDDIDSIFFGGEFGVPTEPFFSSFPPQGRFITAGGPFTYDPSGNLQNCFDSNAPTCTATIGSGTGPNGFNRQNFRTLAVPVERYLFAARGTYEITDDVNFFFEGTFNNTSSSRIIEPFPLESGGANGVFPTGGGYNIENRANIDLNGNGVLEPGEFGLIVANPLVPQEILDASEDSNGDGLRDIGFVRRLSEFGNRTGSTERNFYRFVVGLEGGLFDDRFRWDLSYNYGRVNENQVSSGQVNVPNFRDALAVRAEIGDENGNGIAGEAICIDDDARANGCAPANIFGEGALSQAAVNYIAAQGTFQTGIQQQVVQGNIGGSLFELPAGPLGIAAGFEYRKESSFEDNDALTNAGLNAGNVLPDTSGSFDVKEAYAEVRVPLLADTPFFELLEIGGAVRISDYSTVGSVFSWNVTGTWQPVEDIRFRGTIAEAVRAPNVAELFSGLSQTFPSGLVDPCAGIGASGGGALGDNCRADPGVAANIAANGVFTLSQPDLQGISGFNGGNPNLGEETARSYTAGVVINPRSFDALRNLTVTADYYNYEIEDVISGFPRQFTLDQCYAQGNQTFCDLITRRPGATSNNSAGSIDLINALSVNAAVLKTSGVDVTAQWFTPVGLSDNDRLTLRGAYTHVLEYDFFSLPDADPDPSDGEIGTAKDRFTANVAYQTDDIRLTFNGTFIGRSFVDDQFDGPRAYEIPAEFYLDAQATFFATEAFEFYLGVDNLLDNEAPNILSGITGNVTGSDTAADVYDVFGRRYYAGVRLKL